MQAAFRGFLKLKSFHHLFGLAVQGYIPVSKGNVKKVANGPQINLSTYSQRSKETKLKAIKQ